MKVESMALQLVAWMENQWDRLLDWKLAAMLGFCWVGRMVALLVDSLAVESVASLEETRVGQTVPLRAVLMVAMMVV
jgi:dienelactone hydrolase